MNFDSRGKCYCPNPSCPDASSKHKGAVVNTKNNTLHCFVCGDTWNSFTLAGLRQFGYDRSECFTAEGIQEVGVLVGKELGYSSCLEEIKRGNEKDTLPDMPFVLFHDTAGDLVRFPLYQCFGLTSNPLESAYTQAKDGRLVRMQVERSAAVLMLLCKGLDCLREAQEYMYEESPYLRDLQLVRDYENLRIATENYLPKLYPHMSEADRPALTEHLLYQYVYVGDEAYRLRLAKMFPREIGEIVTNLQTLCEEEGLSLEGETHDENER